MECMLACFNDTTINQAANLIPTIVKEFEKSVAQPSQVLSVVEGLAAACLLLKLASAKVAKEASFNSLWSTVFDMDKQIFLSEKIIFSMPDNGMYSYYNNINVFKN